MLLRRRRRDDRALRDAFRRAAAARASRSPTARWSAAEQLATRFGAEAITLNELPERLHEFDIVVTCTAAHAADHRQGPARARAQGAPARADVHRRSRRAARRRARGRATLDDVFLYTVDDLGKIVRKGNRDARHERGRAGRGDDREPGRPFPALARGRATSCRRSARCASSTSAARRRARARAQAASRAATTRPAVLDALSRGLTNKLLHAPTQALHARGGERAPSARAIPLVAPVSHRRQ